MQCVWWGWASWPIDSHLLAITLPDEKGKEALWGLFYKGIHPIHKRCTLMTWSPSKASLQISSPGNSAYKFWGNTNFQSISSVASLSHVQLFVTLWTAARRASLSITNSQSPPKPMSIESVMPSNHLILSSPSPPAFNLCQHQGLFKWVSSSHKDQSIGVSASTSSFQWTPRTDLL